MDSHVERVLWAAGYSVSSHIMARSTLSGGTGKNEETLTADLADIMGLFDPYDAYLQIKGSRSRFAISVVDFNKHVESNIGADFSIVIRGRIVTGTSVQIVRKAVLVQAKRQHSNANTYAASSNHTDKAKTMGQTVGLSDSFFAFYHRDAVLSMARPATTHDQPNFAYASPLKGHRHFFTAGSLARNMPESFLEPSFFRRYILGSHRSFVLPDGYEWGIGMLPASYFVDAAGTVLNANLPSIAHVLANGSTFSDFLVRLATCQQGTDRGSDHALVQILKQIGAGSLGQGSAAVAPLFALVVQFDSSDGTEVEPDTEFDSSLRELPGYRRYERTTSNQIDE